MAVVGTSSALTYDELEAGQPPIPYPSRVTLRGILEQEVLVGHVLREDGGYRLNVDALEPDVLAALRAIQPPD